MKPRTSTKLVHVGKYAAEVDVTLIDDDHEWAPFLSFEDAQKVAAVHSALRRGDLKASAALARVYELTPVAAE